MEPIRSCLLGCKESWIACFLNDRAVQTLLSLFCGLLSCVCLRMTLCVRGASECTDSPSHLPLLLAAGRSANRG